MTSTPSAAIVRGEKREARRISFLRVRDERLFQVVSHTLAPCSHKRERSYLLGLREQGSEAATDRVVEGGPNLYAHLHSKPTMSAVMLLTPRPPREPTAITPERHAIMRRRSGRIQAWRRHT